jgi:hypothetical protein
MAIARNMKRQVAILLLCCYALALFRPLTSCVSDLLAHTFWHSEHVATVHFENGKYHLHVELREAGDEQENSFPAVPKKQAESVSAHIPAEVPAYIPVLSPASTVFIAGPDFPQPVYIFVSSPPPWSC